MYLLYILLIYYIISICICTYVIGISKKTILKLIFISPYALFISILNKRR